MPQIYEERKAQFEQRIRAMIRYAKNDHICRSRQLLFYFGEHNGHNCHQCDVCLANHSEGIASESKIATAEEAILKLLSDGKPHPITELKSIELPDGELDAAIDYLTNEEYIRQSDGLLTLNS